MILILLKILISQDMLDISLEYNRILLADPLIRVT